MARVEFHFNVPDRVAYVCRLIRKAVALNHRLGVLGPDRLLASIDQSLWTFSPLDFVPHCRLPAAPALRQASPVWLVSDVAELLPQHLLIQLNAEVPVNAGDFARIIEVVSEDVGERQEARSRWRHYTHQGHELIQHNFQHNPARES